MHKARKCYIKNCNRPVTRAGNVIDGLLLGSWTASQVYYCDQHPHCCYPKCHEPTTHHVDRCIYFAMRRYDFCANHTYDRLVEYEEELDCLDADR